MSSWNFTPEQIEKCKKELIAACPYHDFDTTATAPPAEYCGTARYGGHGNRRLFMTNGDYDDMLRYYYSHSYTGVEHFVSQFAYDVHNKPVKLWALFLNASYSETEREKMRHLSHEASNQFHKKYGDKGANGYGMVYDMERFFRDYPGMFGRFFSVMAGVTIGGSIG